MTRKHRRMVVLGVCALALGGAAALSLAAMGDSMAFFLAPSEVATKAEPGRTFRLGGLVQAGSVTRTVEAGVPVARFTVTDGRGSVVVRYAGILPDLFREGQGIVALGHIAPGGTFAAAEVLAKHDESYMPKEVADALKKSGHWNPATGAPPPASTWNAAVAAEKAASKEGGS